MHSAWPEPRPTPAGPAQLLPGSPSPLFPRPGSQQGRAPPDRLDDDYPERIRPTPPLDASASSPPTSTNSPLHLGRSLSLCPTPSPERDRRRSLAVGVAPTTVRRAAESPSSLYIVLFDPTLQDELECPAAAGSSFSPTSFAVVYRDRFRLPSALPFTRGPPCAAP